MKRLCLTIAALLASANLLWAQMTPGGGAGIVVNDPGSSRLQTLVITFGVNAFTAAAVTQDITIATLPKRFKLLSVVADVTTAFTCASVCTTSTLSMTVGKTAGGNEYLASFDLDAAAATFGLATATVGATLQTAANVPVQGGDIPSWTAATTLQARFTSGTGNIGTGTATNLGVGSVTFYVTGIANP